MCLAGEIPRLITPALKMQQTADRVLCKALNRLTKSYLEVLCRERDLSRRVRSLPALTLTSWKSPRCLLRPVPNARSQ